jgi:hypothetical protein
MDRYHFIARGARVRMQMSPTGNRVTAIAAAGVIVAAVVWAAWEMSVNSTVPRWKATLVTSVQMLAVPVLVMMLFYVTRSVFGRKPPQVFRFKCNTCGYPRRGLSRTAPCPECGAPAPPI